MNYTVVGDVVNVASRLESLNKQVGTRILMGPFMHRAVLGQMTTRRLPPTEIKGKAEKLVVFELLGPTGLGGRADPSLDASTGLSTRVLYTVADLGKDGLSNVRKHNALLNCQSRTNIHPCTPTQTPTHPPTHQPPISTPTRAQLHDAHTAQKLVFPRAVPPPAVCLAFLRPFGARSVVPPLPPCRQPITSSDLLLLSRGQPHFAVF
eukprot:EG_transcript_31709